MTQAFNLSQLANKVNTSGNLNASTGLFNQVPVANGGTGKSTVTSGALLVGAGTSAMTELVGSAPGQAVVWNGTTFTTGTVAGAADGINTFIAPGTWTKPSGLLQIKVTVIGAGGNGGSATTPPGVPIFSASGGGGGAGGAAILWMPAPSIPGPVAVTAGAGTNSFGAFASATAGSAGGNAGAGASANGGAGGIGSSGTLNIRGGGGGVNSLSPGGNGAAGGNGGSSILGGGGSANTAGGSFGGGGGGATRVGSGIPGTTAGGVGANGIVIVEEFY